MLSLKEELQEVAMETDPGSEDLHLVLDTSTDASDNKDATESESEGPSINSPKPVPPKPSGIQVKSADGKPRKVQITTLSTFASPSAIKVKNQPESPSSVKVKNQPPVAKSPSTYGIQVKSADGKPKKVQITTLASFSSPKSKSENNTISVSASTRNSGDNLSALKAVENTMSDKGDKSDNKSELNSDSAKLSAESAVIDLTAGEKGDNSSASAGKGTSDTAASPAGAKTSKEGKSTPKRVQLTTIKLFNTPSKDDK